ncbi:MAG: hypothetical protein H5T72_07435 [Actinobacteria bacterium]|nr:hypothetical protein [Actinomycetota bacterium]
MIPDRETLEKRRKMMEEELARPVDALREMGAERVVLIGSMTRDPINPLGDIDLVGNQVVWGRSVAELVDDAGQYDPSFHLLIERRLPLPFLYPHPVP